MKRNRHLGFSVRIFLPDGDPDGVKIVEKSNWTGLGLVFPRGLFAEVRKRPELERTGVYVLVDDKKQFPRVYIGESDHLLPRLEQHFRTKDFWTWGVVFTSKDQNLNKAHVQYLEARLIHLASRAKRCELDNSNTPNLPSLSEADKAEAEGFLADMLLCFPIIGLNVFEEAAAPSRGQRFVIRAKGIEARGVDSPEGFLVLKGSQIVKKEVRSIPPHFSQLRRSLVEQGVLHDAGSHYVLTQDYLFSSPSTAAAVVLGRSANGRSEWKTGDGRTLKQVQDSQLSLGDNAELS